jgi:hypothetical protein
MSNSRDIAVIIMFAVIGFVFMVIIGQVPMWITGIPGLAYVFDIVYSILQSISWLMFEGRRWRIVAQGLLISLLALVVIPVWNPPVAMATITNMFIVDLVFNSFYGTFERKNKLLHWLILGQVYYWATHSFWILLYSSLLFYPFEALMQNWFIPIMSIMLPIIVVEAIPGSYIGYKIYRRVEKII